MAVIEPRACFNPKLSNAGHQWDKVSCQCVRPHSLDHHQQLPRVGAGTGMDPGIIGKVVGWG
jgi:hypothetical protein